MGLIPHLMTFLFGDGRNVVVETAEVFRENAEAAAQRAADGRAASLAQLSAEFARAPRGVFDRLVDAANRLPRPMLALGTIWLFVEAMRDPLSFSQAMMGLGTVPEPLWWLMGAIVSFYFGARHQAKGQDFQREILAGAARARAVLEAGAPLGGDPVAPRAPGAAPATGPNSALADWRAGQGDG